MTNQELQALVEKISHDSFRQPFRHNARFNRRLKTTGGRSLLKKTGGSRFAPKLVAVTFQVYQCQKCHQEIKRRRKIDTKRYVCGSCHGQLEFLKTIES